MKIHSIIEKLRDHEELQCRPISEKLNIYYLKTVCDQDKIDTFLIHPLFLVQDQERYLGSICEMQDINSVDELYMELISGMVLVEHGSNCYFFDANKVLNNSPSSEQIETTIQGPQSSLTEDIKANLNLIRHRYPSKDFNMLFYRLGQSSQTPAFVIYDSKLVDPQVLNELKQKLSSIKASTIQASGQLDKILNKKKRSLFPTMMLTDRPDRIALNLSQGKIVVLLNGTPFALILPAVFYDFMSSMDDLYLPYWISRGLVCLRYIGLFLTITLPAIYISVVSFNPEFFRVQLTLSIAGSRAAVPYPSYLEVIFMLFMTEALTEASIRLPKFMGGTATTVGGLILGQAAQEAGLVSSIMIIVTAAVTISNFVTPINSMSYSVRAFRYPLVALSSLFGLVGVIVGLFCMICYLVNLQSFGQPYLKLFVGDRSKSFHSN